MNIHIKKHYLTSLTEVSLYLKIHFLQELLMQKIKTLIYFLQTLLIFHVYGKKKKMVVLFHQMILQDLTKVLIFYLDFYIGKNTVLILHLLLHQ